MARRRGIVWLALAISLMIAGDLVMDLVFEDPDLVISAEASSIPEEQENAAEHILIPSQKADHFTVTTWLTVTSTAIQAIIMFACLPPLAIARANLASERPPRHSPVPLLLPLRI